MVRKKQDRNANLKAVKIRKELREESYGVKGWDVHTLALRHSLSTNHREGTAQVQWQLV